MQDFDQQQYVHTATPLLGLSSQRLTAISARLGDDSKIGKSTYPGVSASLVYTYFGLSGVLGNSRSPDAGVSFLESSLLLLAAGLRMALIL